jgi:hypothetical protein
MYTSPRMAGLRVGADWTPRNDTFNISTNRLTVISSPTNGINGVFQDLVEVGADYDRSFGGVRLLGHFVYNFGSATKTVLSSDKYHDLSAMQAGVRAEYAGFALGASALNFGKSGQQYNSTASAPRYDADSYNYTLEGQYTAGRLVFGGLYRYGQDPGLMNVPGVRKVHIYEAGIGYYIWDGLQLQFQYDYFNAKSDKPQTAASGSPNDDGNVVTARAVFRF